MFFIQAIVSCKSYKDLKEGEYLVNKVKIEFKKDRNNKSENRQEYVKMEDLQKIVKQKPNKKLFGVFNLSTNLYAYGNRKDNWFSRWVKKMGDEPVILDLIKTENSIKQLKLYLVKNGYFLNQTSDTLIITDSNKKKATVIYKLELNEPYLIKKLSYFYYDSEIRESINEEIRNSKIKKGKNYDENALKLERIRIEKNMKED